MKSFVLDYEKLSDAGQYHEGWQRLQDGVRHFMDGISAAASPISCSDIPLFVACLRQVDKSILDKYCFDPKMIEFFTLHVIGDLEISAELKPIDQGAP